MNRSRAKRICPRLPAALSVSLLSACALLPAKKRQSPETQPQTADSPPFAAKTAEWRNSIIVTFD